MLRALVNEVNIQTIDFSDELIEAIESGLPRPPVIPIGPVTGKVAGVVQWDALGPVLDTFALRPPGPGQPLAQISEVAVWDCDAERSDSRRIVRHGPDYGRTDSLGFALCDW